MSYSVSEAIELIKKYCEEMPSKVSQKVLLEVADYILVQKNPGLIPASAMDTIKKEAENPSEIFSAPDKADFNVTNHPKRYLNKSGIEAIDVIEIIVSDISGPAGFNIGTMIKYLARLGKKTEDVKEEWSKVLWYAVRATQKK